MSLHEGITVARESHERFVSSHLGNINLKLKKQN